MYKSFFGILQSHCILNLIALFAFVVCLICTFFDKKWLLFLFSICIAILSSYIFYIITVDYSRIQNNKNIFASVKDDGKLIISEKNTLVNAFSDYTKINISTTSSEMEMKSMLEKINPYSKDAPQVYWNLEHLSWLQYIKERAKNTQRSIDRIFRFMPFLDTEMVSKLSAIEKSRLLLQIDNYVASQMSNSNLNFMAGDICDYINKVNEFEKYYIKIFK